MSNLYRKTAIAALCGVSLVLAGCNGGGGGGSTSNSTELSGSVTKGPVNGASVTIYMMKADGTRGDKVAGPFSTKPDGSWSGDIPAGATGPFFIVATGGSYKDEATGSDVTLTSSDELVSVITTPVAGGKVNAPITPYTDAIAQAAQKMVTGSTTPAMAIEDAIKTATTLFGFDPTKTIPPNPLALPANASDAEKKYAALLGGFAQLGQDAAIKAASTETFKVMKALAQDIADGKLDGKDLSGNGIAVKTGVALPALGADLSKLLASTQIFIDAKTGYTSVTLPTGLATGGGFYKAPTSAPGGTTSGSCAGVATVYKDDPNAQNPYTDGQQVCFIASPTELKFLDKTLTNPVKNPDYTYYTFTDAATGLQYEAPFVNGKLHEVNVYGSSKAFLGQFEPVAVATPVVSGGGTGTYTLTISLVMGMGGTSQPVATVANVAKPATQDEFCNDTKSQSVFNDVKGAGTVTINSCSFSGDTGSISATVTTTSPAMSMSYTANFTYK